MTPFEESNLKGKTVLWLGTSVPEGHGVCPAEDGRKKTYPDLVGELCGAVIINRALGSSAVHACTRTGKLDGVNTRPFLYSLSHTLEEKERIIENWKTIGPRSYRSDFFPEGLPEAEAEKARGASFERRLLPYLDGTEPMPDLFVFDHGYNDQHFAGAKERCDLTLAPTAENERSGMITPDEYMRKNDFENLRRFFGDLSGIPKARFSEFIASVNRRTYLGASNFLFTLILHFNPYARIVVLGSHLPERKNTVAAQSLLAESWGFPFIRPDQKTGWGAHLVPGSKAFWDPEGKTDLLQKEVFCPDGVHPHYDKNGRSLPLCARAVAEQLRRIVL